MEGIAETNKLSTVLRDASAATMFIASAPVSWSTMESVEPPSENSNSRVLDENAKARISL